MKMTRRIITLLLALVMVLSMSATVFADESDATSESHNYVNGFCSDCGAYEPATEVTEDNYAELGLGSGYVGYYAVGNAGQLYWYEDMVFNAHSRFYSSKMVLTKNITVNEGTITAGSSNVRTWNSLATFDGIIDGNGHSISGLYCVNEDPYHCVGLMTVLMSDGVVKNLTITNSYFSGAYKVGGIVGDNTGTVSGCVNNATVESDDGMPVGGIAGYNEGTVSGCTNKSAISGYSDIGGIAGYNVGTVKYSNNFGAIQGSWNNVGGIVGYNESLISSCGNNVAIKADQKVGGITGVNCGTVELCGNGGNITAVNQLAGGIVGDQQGVVTSCWNTSEIKAGQYAAGGIAGFVGKPDTTPAPVENCWSTGKVTCDGGKTAGGLIGKGMGSLTVRNCYTTMDVAIGEKETTGGTPNISKVETKTREQFASGEVTYLLGGVWGQNIDNGETVQTIPVFSKATVYQIEADGRVVGYSNDPNADPNNFAPATEPEETQSEETQPEETEPTGTEPEGTEPEETTPKDAKPKESKPKDETAVDPQSSADDNGSTVIYIIGGILGASALTAAILLVIKYLKRSAG